MFNHKDHYVMIVLNLKMNHHMFLLKISHKVNPQVTSWRTGRTLRSELCCR